MWFWLSLMNPHRLTWGYAYQLHVALIVGGATLVAWLFSRESKRPPSTPLTYTLAAFTFWVSFSTIFALVPADAFQKWQEIIKILGMTFVTMCIVNSRERIYQLVWVIAISLGFYGFRGGIFGLLTGGNYRVWGPPDSFIADNNQLALALIMTLPLLNYLRLMAMRRWVQLGLLSAIGFTIISILCSYSRGAFLSLIITLVALWLKTRHRLVTALATLGVLACALFWLPASWYDRMNTITNYEHDSSAQGRLTAWSFAIKLAVNHPLVGGGLEVNSDKSVYQRYEGNLERFQNFHSIYFQVLAENGFIGLGLFLLLISSSLATARWIIRRTRDRPDLAWANLLAGSIQVSIVGYCVAGAFLNLGFYDLYYALIAVLASTRAVVAKEVASQRRISSNSPEEILVRDVAAESIAKSA